MKCPVCSRETRPFSEGTTCVGYPEYDDELGHHDHDDNCLSHLYYCDKGHSGHPWREYLRRRCPNERCDWIGKAECFCHAGAKVDAWADAEIAETE